MNNNKRDLPNSIVFILVIIAILVSVLGSWSLLEAVTSSSHENEINPVTDGQVSFQIIEPVKHNDNTKGQVNFEIINNEG